MTEQPNPTTSHAGGDSARRNILRVVEARPGVHKSELCRTVGLGWGTVSYHLRLLEKARRLQTLTGNRETRVFPAHIPTDQLGAYAALRAGSGEAIGQVLAHKPGARQQEICQALGQSRKLIRRHLEILRKEGLVSSQGERRARYSITPAFELLLHGNASASPPAEPPAAPGHAPDGPPR